jgi:hypothetical protein
VEFDRGGKRGIPRDHPPGTKKPVSALVAHLQILAIVLESVERGEIGAQLLEAACRIVMVEDQLHIFGALFEIVVFGCIQTSLQHPKAGQAE